MRQRNPSSEQSDNLITSDLILPSQFYELVGKNRFSSEQRLMLAVLADAINILQEWHGAAGVRKRRLFTESARWVMTHGNHVPFSFDNVCEALQVNPDALRQKLLWLMSGNAGDARPRLRLKEAGRLQHMTVNRTRRRDPRRAMNRARRA